MWSLSQKTKKNGATLWFPGHLENTPFNDKLKCILLRSSSSICCIYSAVPRELEKDYKHIEYGFLCYFFFGLLKFRISDPTKKTTTMQACRPWVCHTQILADQLTLFQQGGTDYAHLITTGTPGF